MKQQDHMSAAEYKKKYVREHDIQTEGINFLRAHGWYVQRLNSGVVSADYTYKRGYMKGVTKSRKIWMSRRGTPDIMAFKPTGEWEDENGQIQPIITILFVEYKKEGEDPNEDQIRMMEELTAYGAICVIARSIEDLEPYK